MIIKLMLKNYYKIREYNFGDQKSSAIVKINQY